MKRGQNSESLASKLGVTILSKRFKLIFQELIILITGGPLQFSGNLSLCLPDQNNRDGKLNINQIHSTVPRPSIDTCLNIYMKLLSREEQFKS